MSTVQPIIVFLRQDLRLADNPALYYAAETGAPLIVIYVLDDETPGKWRMGAAQRWWLHHSLNSLGAALKSKGATLILRRGNTLEIISQLVKQTNAQAVYFNRCYEPYAIALEKNLANTLKGIAVHSFNSGLLIEPWKVSTQQGSPYKVFTKFWLTASKSMEVPPPLHSPHLAPFQGSILSDAIQNWNLLPFHPNWAIDFGTLWEPGEEGGAKKMAQFLSGAVNEYAEGRNIPSKIGTSRISPHLHFGEVSARQFYHAVMSRPDLSPNDVKVFISEIGWREFTHYSLVHFPTLPDVSFQERFKTFPWKDNPDALKAWQKGQVGYPIVDAGMRELWHTGWMHNRVRMIVASFLTKDLMIPWQKGEEWFWDTLVDADLASNSFSWQWTAGCGMDAAPYFRIFNPVLQGEKFDSDGTYIKKWVPELRKMPAKYIHQPWNAPAEVLKACGVQLGENYPLPIVDHNTARDEALKLFKTISG